MEQERLERLKELYKADLESWKEQMFELQQRIDKAIEYIEKNKKTILKDQADFFNEDRKDKSKLKVGTFMWNIDNLLEILKGE